MFQEQNQKVMNGLVLTASCSPHCPQHDSLLCSPVVAADTPCDHLLQLHGQAFAVSLHHGHWQEPHSAATTAHTDDDLAIKQYLGQETGTLMQDLEVLYLQHQVRTVCLLLSCTLVAAIQIEHKTSWHLALNHQHSITYLKTINFQLSSNYGGKSLNFTDENSDSCWTMYTVLQMWISNKIQNILTLHSTNSACTTYF